jgi:ubiquitin C-terminal hydrolase
MFVTMNRRLRIRPENKKHGHTFRCHIGRLHTGLYINWFLKDYHWNTIQSESSEAAKRSIWQERWIKSYSRNEPTRNYGSA